MNEKNHVVNTIFIGTFLFTATSCCTGKGLYYNSTRAGEIRSNLGELASTETATFEGNENIKLQIAGSLENIRRLEELIEAGDGDIEEFKEILRRIRERSSK